MRKISLFLAMLAAIQITFAQNATELINVTDMLKINTIGNITVSKDGTKAAFTVTSIEPDANNKLDYKYLTQLYSISTTGNPSPIQLTTTKEGAAQPAWKPDGSQLAFVRTIEGKPQIFILPMNGGEPMQLTKYKYGASNPKWSPDGKQILFSSSISFQDLLKDSVLNTSNALPIWSFEKPGFDKNGQFKPNTSKSNPDGNINEVRAYLDTNISDKKSIVLNKLNFQNEFNVSAEMNFNHFLVINATKVLNQLQLQKASIILIMLTLLQMENK